MMKLRMVVIGLLALGGHLRAEDVRLIVESSGIRGGLIVHLGCGDGRLTAALRVGDSYLVHGLDANADNVQTARAHVRSLGLYGNVSIDRLVGARLPYADNLVNLLIVTDMGSISQQECLRVLAPRGAIYIKADGKWQKRIKRWPAEIDEWTHHLHDASGNAVARDSVVGPPRHLQWTAGPLWARSHGWTPTVTAMVSSAGRLFYICDETLTGAGDAVPSKWFLVARDAFSGVRLWKQPVPVWGSTAMSGTADTGGSVSVGRFTMPPHAAKRLVAVGDTVYVTLGADAPVTALDAATGEVKRSYEATARADEILCLDGRVIVSLNPPPSARPPVVEKDDTPPPAPGKHVGAVDVASGTMLWRAGPFEGVRAGRGQDPFGRLELCAGDGKVFLLTAKAIECLSLESGDRLWQVARPALPPDAVRRLGFSGIYEYQLTVLLYQQGVLLLAQPEPNTHHTYHTMPGTLYAFDARSGGLLWKHGYGGWGHCTPPDVFVVRDNVWAHVDAATEYGSVWGNGYRALDTSKVDYRIQALALQSGVLQHEHSTKEVFNVEHHHRCYRNKITERFLLSSRRGVEFVDLATGENYQNHWVRSGCKVGNLPCNGMLYVAPHPCQCYIDAKLIGFNALAPARDAAVTSLRDRLERGPAYGSIRDEAGLPAAPSDWPTYRHDMFRSGSTESTVDFDLEIAWTSNIGAMPSGLVVAGGKVLVAGTDEHTVFALDSGSGAQVWTCTVGGRVKSPPTYYRGTAIFGSADGCIYCLRATDGELVWRFQAAPERRFVTALDQLESAWPVPGVLVKDGVCWFAAGRSSYLDGGIHVYALDALSGQVLHRETIYSPDPQTGKMAPVTNAQEMSGLLNDVPGSDGTNVFIRQMCVSTEGRSATRKHLYTTAGFLDSTWFNRTFWRIGRAQTTGPMVLGDGVAYGVEPFTSRSRDVVIQPGSNPYRLWCLPIDERAVARLDRRGKQVQGAVAARPLWDRRLSIRANALIRAGDVLLVAGSPDTVDPADPHGAWEGRQAGVVAAIATADGSPRGELRLPALPIWDGMAVAEGRLFVALQNGAVLCLE